MWEGGGWGGGVGLGPGSRRVCEALTKIRGAINLDVFATKLRSHVGFIRRHCS